jgi:hypothetical protein
MIPAEEFKKFASECLDRAKSSRSRDSKAAWDHMAARWARCAEISEQQAAAAKLDRTARQHARIRNGRAVAAWMWWWGWWRSAIVSARDRNGHRDHARDLVYPLRVCVSDLDCPPALNIAYKPTRLEHDPRRGTRRATQASFCYFHAADEDEHVIVVILVNRA